MRAVVFIDNNFCGYYNKVKVQSIGGFVMNYNLRKLMSLFLVISLIVGSLAGISMITSNAQVANLIQTGITTYNLDVGDTKYIFLDESDKAIQSAAWTSNAPFDVEIISQDSVHCQVKVNNYISTTAIITCEYYYQQLNALTGQIWLIKGAKSFYVKVNEDSQTVTPTNPTEPNTPDNTSKTYIYDRGTLGVYKYIVKADGTAEITNYEYKLETSITIPSAINGYAVTSIGENAFEYCGKLKGITIPEGVTDIKNKAFYFCYNLESITLPTTLVSIGDYAFQNCEYVDSITLPEGLASVGKWAFCAWRSLTSVNIPQNLTSIGLYAFGSCDSLESINVDESNPAYTSVDGVLFSKDMKTIVRYPDGKTDTEYTIPEGVTTVGNRSFASCQNLTKINIPQSVTAIENNAFQFSPSLESITIPQSVTFIGNQAFGYSEKLKHMILPEGITEICDYTFQGCVGLESLYIPESVTSFGYMAFDECSKDLIIYGYKGSEAEALATKRGYNFVALTKLEDTDSGICIERITEAESALQVTEITSAASIDEVNLALNNEAILKLYDLSLIKDITELQPELAASVKIPTDNELTKVYRIENDGSLTDMNAMYMNGYMVLSTDSLGLYALAVPAAPAPAYQLGDANTDGDVNIKDATAIQKHIAGIELLSTEGLKVADYNADEDINIKDATAIQKFIAGILQ